MALSCIKDYEGCLCTVNKTLAPPPGAVGAGWGNGYRANTWRKTTADEHKKWAEMDEKPIQEDMVTYALVDKFYLLTETLAAFLKHFKPYILQNHKAIAYITKYCIQRCY